MQRGETIGRGHFAKVKLVRHRQSRAFYAAKLLDKELEEHMEDYQAMKREFEVLRQLQHINIVRLFEAYESPKTLILVTELATGGELMHRIVEELAVYSEAEVKKHIHTILKAVDGDAPQSLACATVRVRVRPSRTSTIS